MLTHHKVEIAVSGIELVGLKKLSLVSHALASKFDDYRSKEEQTCLAEILDDVIRRLELALARAAG